MKIFVTHAKGFDFENELYNPLRQSGIAVKHQFIFPEEGEKKQPSKQFIQDCDLVLAEVSYPSTGSGIELGWADVFQKPIICMHKEGSKVSMSLKKITNVFIPYKNKDDMVQKLAEELENRYGK